MGSDRPNVVLVVLDTARADSFEPYGAPAGASPVVADLARRGRAVHGAFAPSNWTLPSHASMLTGLPARDTGLGQAPGGQAGNCRPYLEALEPRYLPAVLRAAGYRTSGISANLWITSWSGFATGFDRFVDLRTGRGTRVHERSVRARARWAVEAWRARVDDGARAAAELLAGWLAAGPDRPFFWFVNLVECHSPFLPPRPWTPLGPLGRVRTAREALQYLTLMGMWSASAGALQVPADAVARMRMQYAGAIRQLDDWLGRLLDLLEGHRLLDDTVVVVTSDHGENLGESGRLGHCFWLDDRLIRVPLVVAGPIQAPTGRVTSLTRLPRMVADAVGLTDHPWQAGEDPDGVVVAQSQALTDAGDERLERARAELGLDRYAVWRMTTSSTAATDGERKLVREHDEDWLYDLTLDPAEAAPRLVDGRVVAEYGETVRVLQRAVDRAHTAGPPPPAGTRAARTEQEVPADLEDRMRLLGYL